MDTFYRAAGMILIFSLLTSAGTSALAQAHIPPEPPGEPESTVEIDIEPELLRAILEADSNGNENDDDDEYLRVIVYLREQADLETAVSGALSVAETRSRVVSALQTTAARSQAPLQAYLEEGRAAERVDSYTPFWIFNGIAVRAHPSFIRALAAHPAVAAVRLDHYRRWISNSRFESADRGIESPTSIEWGLSRIRADQVWASLQISGTGVVVAGMDTGVDWLHPALQANYRAYNPHSPTPTNHIYSWHDATDGGALYPVDGHGHGSHTLGTIIGQDGIGVAPGARWIAVKVLNNQGFGYDSWIHEGFQWLLAPGGDPTKAPDVVNNSWGNDNGSLTTFQPDLRALRAAGIFAVFSNGNSGPERGTVGSPASLPEAFAVGATDSDDEVASFSSRGPSRWGEIRPHVAAPGVHVRSTLPGGAYGAWDGTSMAAPHVSGIVALLRSVSPTLSITRAALIITSTAVPLGNPIPNNDAGWGRVDAFAAVVALAQPGLVTGTVARAGDGAPIAGAMVVAAPHGGSGGGGRSTTDDDGAYLLALAPTTYDLTASAFGYEPATAWGIVVTTNTMTRVDLSLAALPTGILQGHITDAATGEQITATVTAVDTPLEIVASGYTFTLPAGDYTVRARRLGYRVVTATAHVTAGQITVTDLALPAAPSILLVDSGPWYYGSQANYFSQPLDDLAYVYDERSIKHLPDDTPTATDLSPYDVVIWSAPRDAPGYIRAENAIVGYLSGGGRLLLTGQDIGFWDGGGAMGFWSAYYRDYLKARYVSDNAPTRVLKGIADDILAGLTITITGSGGADNQDYPDVISIADPDGAAPILVYQKDGCGGARIGTCLNYRAVYLPFGFEAINDRATRREVMDRALDWLTSPAPTVGLELEPVSQMRVGLPGSIVTHTLRVRHVGQGGITDTVSLSLSGASWDSRISAPSLSLAPCISASVVVSVTIPITAGWDVEDVITLTAHSSLSPTLAQTAAIVTKAPAPILLVDDDRWYNQEAKYKTALADDDLPYDYWRIESAYGQPSWGSPPSDILRRYPIVVWFTGYDWYAPVTAEEAAALTVYLDGRGRLFLSSQDFLYYHHDDHFGRDYLGVVDYSEDVTPTLASGAPENPIGDRLGPYSLDYPFKNWSDAVVPAPGVGVPFRDQERRPIALAHQGRDYRTVFFSFPFETLPQAGRAEVMERVVGWLSWLGGSTFAVDREAVSSGDTLTYTIAVRNDGPEMVSASLSNTLPSDISLIPASLTGPAVYHTSTRQLSWEGPLSPDEAITVTYRAALVPGSALSPIVNTARFGLEDHYIRFHRAAVVRVDTPDLSPSTLQCAPSPTRPGATVTCTLALVNVGPAGATQATATNLLPEDATLIPGSPTWSGGGTVEAPTGTVRWSGPLSAGGQVSLSYQLILSTNPVHPPLYNVAFLEDGAEGAWERATWLLLEPLRCYLPLILRD